MTVGFVVLAWVATYWKFLLPAAPYPFESLLGYDAQNYHYLIQAFISESWRAGDWPLWNHWQQAGFPLYADPQTQMWWPPTLLATTLGFLEPRPFQVMGIATFLAGGLSFLVLARTLKLSNRVGAFGAAAWMGAAVFFVNGQYLGIAWGYAVFPAALALVVRGIGGAPLGWVWAGVLWGGVGLAMHPSIILAGGVNLVAMAFALGPEGAEARPGQRMLARRLAGVGLFAAFCVLLYGVQLLPTLYHKAEMNRGALTFEQTVNASYVTPSYFLTFLVPGLGRLQTLTDKTHMCSCYVGLGTIVLLPVVFIMRRRSRLRLALGVGALVNMLVAMGPWTFLRPATVMLPVFNYFNYPAMNYRGFALFYLIVLGALALQDWLHGMSEQIRPGTRGANAPVLRASGGDPSGNGAGLADVDRDSEDPAGRFGIAAQPALVAGADRHGFLCHPRPARTDLAPRGPMALGRVDADPTARPLGQCHGQ